MKLAATRNRRRKSKLSKLSYCTFICNVSVVPGRLSYFLPSLSSIAIVIAKSNDSTQESSVHLNFRVYFRNISWLKFQYESIKNSLWVKIVNGIQTIGLNLFVFFFDPVKTSLLGLNLIWVLQRFLDTLNVKMSADHVLSEVFTSLLCNLLFRFFEYCLPKFWLWLGSFGCRLSFTSELIEAINNRL